MEQPILFIAGLTLIALVIYIFLWWRNSKKQNQLSENRHNEIVSAIDTLKKSVDGHLQAIALDNAQFKSTLTESHERALIKVSDQLSNIQTEIKNEFNGLKSENTQFKNALTTTHEQALKKINEELTKILNEIKSPLNID